ncbi:MAG: CpsD/CapB family tyrosine-protein kinase [Vicinamibacterales bacterium]
MSRIEQALRRAQGGGDTPSAHEPPPTPAPAETTADWKDDSHLAEAWGFREDEPRVQPPAPVRPPAEPEPATASTTTTDATGAEPNLTSRLSGGVSEKLVVGSPAEAAPAAAEQYRQLAAALHRAQKERNLSVIMVASAIAGEGKTLTSTNLALTLSESYRKRVLLIDADLRRPAIHEVFQIPNTAGLTDGLRTARDQKLPVVRVSQRLTILTAGRPTNDPMGILTSDRMKRLIEEAVERFDWVIIDTPPVGLLTDANLLGAIVDAAVLVVAAGSTPFDLVQRAVEALGRERIFGVVLNRVGPRESYAGYDYGKYYQKYLDTNEKD